MDPNNLRVVVAQLGARQHYQVPLACHRNNSLARMHTDFWKPLPKFPVSKIGGTAPGFLKRAAGRSHSDLPDNLIRSYSLEATYWESRLKFSRNKIDRYKIHTLWGSRFAKKVAASLREEEFTTFFGFSSTSLEALNEAKKQGALTVLDEIAPTHIEDKILAQEQSRFPGWEPRSGPTPQAFLDRMREEWSVADRILVNSEWSRKALLSEGVPVEKLHVVPIAYHKASTPIEVKSRQPNEPLKVLWLGTLCLRKGFPYAVEAARMLESENVTFTFAGPTNIDLSAVNLPKNVTILGQVPRSDVRELWQSHHVFILPSLSDGFAITQLEAVANGLPIITTPNCGDVVEHGRCGLRIAPCDSQALADAVRIFLDGEVDLQTASEQALERSRSFSLDAVWPQIKTVLSPG